MGTFNQTEARIIMLEIVNPDIAKLFDESKNLWNILSQAEVSDTNTRGVRLVASVRPNPGMLWKGESDRMAVGGTSRRIEMNVTFADFNMSGRITGTAIDTTDRHALAKSLSSRMAEDIETALAEWNQTSYEDGTGVKAVVSDVTNAATGEIVFAAPFGARRVLNEGRYNFYSPSGTLRAGGVVTVEADGVDVATSTVTFTAAVNAAVQVGDYLTLEGSYGKTITGLRNIINNDSGTFQNKSRATEPLLKAVVDDAGGAALSVAAMSSLKHKVMYKANNGVNRKQNDFTMISSPAQHEAYLELGFPLIAYNDGGGAGKNLDLGFGTATFEGMPWVLDNVAPDDEIFFLRRNTIKRFELKKLGVLDRGGNTLHLVPGFDSSGVGAHYEEYVYYINAKGELGSTEPNANARLKNLSTSNLPHGRF
jgi:hypothetical protein